MRKTHKLNNVLNNKKIIFSHRSQGTQVKKEEMKKHEKV